MKKIANSRDTAPTRVLKPLVLALVCAGVTPALAQATLPTGFTLGAGQVATPVLSTDGKTMTITQSSARGVANWTGFSIGEGYTVKVAQPGVSSVLLNRVTGLDASNIAGALKANGNVYLINPNGVAFSGTARVDVGGIVASTLGLENAAFMAGGKLTFAGPSTSSVVVNRGAVINANGAENGGSGVAALIGNRVENSGEMLAPGGTVALAAASQVVLDPVGDGLTTLRIPAGAFASEAQALNGGLMAADGGKVQMLGAGMPVDGLNVVVNQAGIVRARSLNSRTGTVELDAGSSDSSSAVVHTGVIEAGALDAGANGGSVRITGSVAGVQGATQTAPILMAMVRSGGPGTIDASGANGGTVEINAPYGAAVLGVAKISADGTAGSGGKVTVNSKGTPGIAGTGITVVDGQTTISANGSTNGGQIALLGTNSLRAYGGVSAAGGSGGGGHIETSAAAFDVSGIRVNSSGAAGPGTWLIDPYDVTITHGSGPGTLPTNPFTPVANATIQDGDINAALNAGNNVTITTGGASGTSAGYVYIRGAYNPSAGTTTPVSIARSAGAAPVTFRVDADGPIVAYSDTSIRSTAGPLNVQLSGGLSNASGYVEYGGQIATNGGDLTVNGRTSAGAGAYLAGSRIDLGAAGSARITGTTQDPWNSPGVNLSGASIRGGAGDVSVVGISNGGHGVDALGASISTTSGRVLISGVGRGSTFSGVGSSSNGVQMGNWQGTSDTAISTGSGEIRIAGTTSSPDVARVPTGKGVLMLAGSSVSSTSGAIDVTGSTPLADAGVQLDAAAGTTPAARIASGGNVVLRASSTGTSDALVMNGAVSAGGVLNLRPGAVDAAGVASDRVGEAITLGGTAATGFAVSQAEFGRMSAPTIVVGSDAHAANIDVVGALGLTSGTTALTLQNDAGGAINIGAPLAALNTVGLSSRGNVTQSAAAPITANVVLARSGAGSVILDNRANDAAANTVGGSAAGQFVWVDANAVHIGPVTATGMAAATNQPQTIAANALTADTVRVQALTGNLSLGMPITATTGTDLVSAGTFQNTAAGTISGGPWRVWADTWVGENRATLAGSGTYPNLYGCAYLGTCAVTVSAVDNHFIYRQQPTATVTIQNASRMEGMANPPFTQTVSGLILGDTGAGITGTPTTTAVPSSPAGNYAINGTYTSAQGYLVNVVPGTLAVTAAPPPPPVVVTPPPPPVVVTPPTPPVVITPPPPPVVVTPPPPPVVTPPPPPPVAQIPVVPLPDQLLDQPNTYTFDRNISPPPICLATGPLGGERSDTGVDLLAQEWARVRSRPNLTNCVDTERKNGCSDF